ncbi:hypothetical protein CGCA056_v012775 [Colletotrichum aenigma]|nr:uncharacterized protein CGCA056_v012775 [Colletotrichum aenigma]KAF5507432.1 hypothetical protein CGCA056_v012775 [Colletotrichum aenigma]
MRCCIQVAERQRQRRCLCLLLYRVNGALSYCFV